VWLKSRQARVHGSRLPAHVRTGSMPPRFINLLAAHFASGDLDRVERLRRLLRSVEGQTTRVPLLMSWSADEAHGAAGSAASRVRSVLTEFEQRGVLRALPRPARRLKQFQHYARLHTALRRHFPQSSSFGDTPFLLFSDDDDIWHPQRVEAYSTAQASQPSAEVLVSRLHSSPGLSPSLPVSTSAAEVTKLQAEGKLRMTTMEESPSEGLFGSSAGEYFDIAVSLGVFDSFFAGHNAAVLANTFADIRFRSFALKWPHGTHRFLPRPTAGGEEPWMYHYDRPLMPYTSAPTEEDLHYLCDALPDPRRIAGLRQTLDCVLFQLAPTQGPLQLAEEDFREKLVGILAEQTAATEAMALDRCRLHGVEVVQLDGRPIRGPVVMPWSRG